MTRDDEGDGFEDKRGLVRNDHPDTAYAAADDILPKSGTLRRKVYDCIAAHMPKGITDLEQQRLLEMIGSTQRPRRVELVTAGLVKDSGRRRRLDGKWRIVWVLA